MAKGSTPLILTTAAVLIAAAGPVLAQIRPPAFPPFPATRNAAAMADWAERYTDLPLAEVVAVGADSLFAVELANDQPAAPAVRVTVRQEAIAPDFARRLGGRSAALVADIDCTGRRVFQRGVDLYVGSNRQGADRALGAASDWQAIPPGTYMEKVMSAACEPEWRSPLLGLGPQPATPPQPAPPPPAALPPRPYVAAAPASGGLRAELGRFASVAAALAAWRDIGAATPAAAGRSLRIEIAAGQYRALVEGFASPGEAQGFCAAVQHSDHACQPVP